MLKYYTIKKKIVIDALGTLVLFIAKVFYLFIKTSKSTF